MAVVSDIKEQTHRRRDFTLFRAHQQIYKDYKFWQAVPGAPW